MFARDVMPMLVGMVYLLVGIGELAFYLGQSPAFWRFLARFRFAVAVEPWSGLTSEALKGFHRQTPQSLVSYDSQSGALVARRTHGVGVRRMPAVVYVVLKPDGNGGLVPEARWGFVPFLGLLAFVLSGQALFLAMTFGGPGSVDVADVLWALLMPMVPFSLMSVVAFFLGRNAGQRSAGRSGVRSHGPASGVLERNDTDLVAKVPVKGFAQNLKLRCGQP